MTGDPEAILCPMLRYCSLVFFVLLITQCKERNSSSAAASKNLRYVLPSDGLRLRAEPSAASAALALIPQGTRLDIDLTNAKAETIGKSSGKWVKASYEGKSGYIFDAYVTDQFAKTINRSDAINIKAATLFERAENPAISSAERAEALSQLMKLSESVQIDNPGDIVRLFHFCQAALEMKVGDEKRKFAGTSEELAKAFAEALKTRNRDALRGYMPSIIDAGCYACDGGAHLPAADFIAGLDTIFAGRQIEGIKMQQIPGEDLMYEVIVTGNKEGDVPFMLLRIEKTNDRHQVGSIRGGYPLPQSKDYCAMGA